MSFALNFKTKDNIIKNITDKMRVEAYMKSAMDDEELLISWSFIKPNNLVSNTFYFNNDLYRYLTCSSGKFTILTLCLVHSVTTEGDTKLVPFKGTAKIKNEISIIHKNKENFIFNVDWKDYRIFQYFDTDTINKSHLVVKDNKVYLYYSNKEDDLVYVCSIDLDTPLTDFNGAILFSNKFTDDRFRHGRSEEAIKEMAYIIYELHHKNELFKNLKGK